MKHSFFLFTLITCFLFTNAQDSAENRLKNEQIFSQVEQEAYFPGGDAGWQKFLAKTIKTDVPVSNGAPAGIYTVIVRFIVTKDGDINNVSARTNYGYGMEDEAVKAIKQSGKWIPAQQNYKQVNAYCEKAIVFEIPNKYKKDKSNKGSSK